MQDQRDDLTVHSLKLSLNGWAGRRDTKQKKMEKDGLLVSCPPREELKAFLYSSLARGQYLCVVLRGGGGRGMWGKRTEANTISPATDPRDERSKVDGDKNENFTKEMSWTAQQWARC